MVVLLPMKVYPFTFTGFGKWYDGTMCGQRVSPNNSVAHNMKPCCVDLKGTCDMISHEHCVFLNGIFHAQGPEHCSQVILPCFAHQGKDSSQLLLPQRIQHCIQLLSVLRNHLVIDQLSFLCFSLVYIG